MAKYFLHIDPTEEDFFQKPTRLLYIDDEDPDMVLYCFSDGTKCNLDFVAPLSEVAPTVGTKRMIEISAPDALWKFTKREVASETKKEKARDGVIYEAADPYFVDMNGNKNIKLSNEEGVAGSGFVSAGTRYDIIAPRPSRIPVEKADDYYLTYIKYALENNIELSKDVFTGAVTGETFVPEVTESKKPAKFNFSAARSPKTKLASINLNSNKANTEEIKNTSLENKTESTTSISSDEATTLDTTHVSISTVPERPMPTNLNINGDTLETITVTYGGETKVINIKDYFTKPVQKPVVQKYTKLSDNTNDNISIDIINTPEWELVNNMINMSQKEVCEIDMSLTLSLPPIDVYRLIKQVYSPSMADAFVKTIANRMPILDLKTSLAQGLLSYYDELRYTDLILEIIKPEDIDITEKDEVIYEEFNNESSVIE